MPMPRTYAHASKDWQAFLADAQDRMGLVSENSTYTAVDAVLQVFRRRLAPPQALAFADVLPAVLRALFLYNWDVEAPPIPFTSRAEMTHEAQSIRPHHNLTPENCIEAVAWALRRHTRQINLDRVLASIGPEAQAFWHVEALPEELNRRIT